jgi:hypothetical protein
MSAAPHREEFERRLLALVRDYMDGADRRYADGYEIGDFMVLLEVFTRVADSDPLEPWSGSVRAGFNSPGISLSSTTSSYWLDEALLAEALAHVRERRSALDENGDADSDDTQEE